MSRGKRHEISAKAAKTLKMEESMDKKLTDQEREAYFTGFAMGIAFAGQAAGMTNDLIGLLVGSFEGYEKNLSDESIQESLAIRKRRLDGRVQ